MPLVASAMGILLRVGASKRRRCLVDPPTWMVFFCAQALFKQALFKPMFGTESCRRLPSFLGFVLVLVSTMFLAARGFGIVSPAGSA